MTELNSPSIGDNLSPDDKKGSSREAPDSPFKSLLSKIDSYLFEENDCTVSVVRLTGEYKY